MYIVIINTCPNGRQASLASLFQAPVVKQNIFVVLETFFVFLGGASYVVSHFFYFFLRGGVEVAKIPSPKRNSLSRLQTICRVVRCLNLRLKDLEFWNGTKENKVCNLEDQQLETSHQIQVTVMNKHRNNNWLKALNKPPGKTIHNSVLLKTINTIKKRRAYTQRRTTKSTSTKPWGLAYLVPVIKRPSFQSTIPNRSTYYIDSHCQVLQAFPFEGLDPPNPQWHRPCHPRPGGSVRLAGLWRRKDIWQRRNQCIGCRKCDVFFSPLSMKCKLRLGFA